MPEVATVVLYDSILFERGHNIHRWAETLQRRFVLNAKQAAPARTGQLREDIHGWVERVGPKHLLTYIASEAPQSIYVLGGTKGPIMSDAAWAGELNEKGRMPMMKFSNAWPPRSFHTVVRGQSKNNFFADAAAQTAVTNPSLRGFHPQYLSGVV